MALLRFKILYGIVLGMTCQVAVALEIETISFDSLASNFNSRVESHDGKVRIANLGIVYSLVHLDQRGPRFSPKTVSSFSSNIYTLPNEPIEIFVKGGTCRSVIVGYYVDEQASAKYELPLGIDPSESLTNTFNCLREKNVIIDKLEEEDEEALQIYSYRRSKATPKQIAYAESCDVRHLTLRSDGNGYSQLSFKYRSQIPVTLYYYKERFIGFVIGWNFSPYFPELCAPNSSQIPGPLGKIRGKRNKWVPRGLNTKTSNNIGIVEIEGRTSRLSPGS